GQERARYDGRRVDGSGGVDPGDDGFGARIGKRPGRYVPPSRHEVLAGDGGGEVALGDVVPGDRDGLLRAATDDGQRDAIADARAVETKLPDRHGQVGALVVDRPAVEAADEEHREPCVHAVARGAADLTAVSATRTGRRA